MSGGDVLISNSIIVLVPLHTAVGNLQTTLQIAQGLFSRRVALETGSGSDRQRSPESFAVFAHRVLPVNGCSGLPRSPTGFPSKLTLAIWGMC